MGMINKIIERFTKKDISIEVEKKTGIPIRHLSDDDFQRFANISGKSLKIYFDKSENAITIEPEDEEPKKVARFMPW